ncbi:hypothetical protein [Sutterella wadsworthensis]|uniref:hypothetical protein n=1 Tax=Sutterella wadsworthensis TaxID=40545 RepID=UPI003966DA26
MNFFVKCLNAVGLHTEAELVAARRKGALESGAQPTAPEVPNSPAALDHSLAGVLYRRTAEDLAVMPVSLQVQVKAQTVVKLQKMVERSLLTQEEFEIWKRRIMML